MTSPVSDMRTANGTLYRRVCGDVVPLPNGRIIILSGAAVSQLGTNQGRQHHVSSDANGTYHSM